MRARAGLAGVLAGIAALGLVTAAPAGAGEDHGADYAPGEKLTLLNCGRCHVVNERNRMGGIGSTPSFAVMRARVNWEERMRAFYTEPPHAAITQIEGVTKPFPIDRPSPIHPMRLTLEEIDRILDYVRTLEPLDLDDKVKIR